MVKEKPKSGKTLPIMARRRPILARRWECEADSCIPGTPYGQTRVKRAEKRKKGTTNAQKSQGKLFPTGGLSLKIMRFQEVVRVCQKAQEENVQNVQSLRLFDRAACSIGFASGELVEGLTKSIG